MTAPGIAYNTFTDSKAPSYPAIPLRGLLPVQRRAINAAIETCLALLAAAPKVQSFNGTKLGVVRRNETAGAVTPARDQRLTRRH